MGLHAYSINLCVSQSVCIWIISVTCKFCSGHYKSSRVDQFEKKYVEIPS